MNVSIKLMPKGKTQICKNKDCLWYDTSQQVIVTIQSKKLNYELKQCSGCKGKLILDDESNYEN